MAPTVHLRRALPDGRDSIDGDAVELRGNCAHVDRGVAEDSVVVPMDNVAGIEGPDVSQEVDQHPTQGGQYSEVVTRIS